MLCFEDLEFDGLLAKSAVFDAERTRLVIPVRAIIGNSITTSDRGKLIRRKWMQEVFASTRKLRGNDPLDAESHYVITGAFRFHPGSHGNQKLDVENFLKPTFDALAAGLFCDECTMFDDITRFGYDDSGFRYLFVHRLTDATSAEEEGALMVVSEQAT